MQMRKNMQKLMLVAICLLLAVSSFAQIAPTPANERIKGLEKKTDLIRQSTINDVAFRNVGPSIMSGRVVDLAVNPANPNEFYVAYATGGLWYTHNNGQS